MESIENSNIDKLSPREKEVATYIANGVSTNDIAKILGVKLPFNSFVGKSHQEEIDFLKSWIRKRLTWMDSEIGKL